MSIYLYISIYVFFNNFCYYLMFIYVYCYVIIQWFVIFGSIVVFFKRDIGIVCICSIDVKVYYFDWFIDVNICKYILK